MSSASSKRNMKIWASALLLFLLLLATLLRLDFLIASDFVIDSDEAIVGLMAKHILEGHPLPVFYYGQHYMGSFEPLLVALGFLFLGVSSVVLKLVPLACSIFWIYLVYRIGKRVGGEAVGLLSLLLASLAPVALLVWSAKARGGFIELMCIGALSALFLFQLLDKKRIRLSELFLLAALLGFGWWVNNQIIYFMLPAGLLLLTALREETSSWREFFQRGLAWFGVGLLGFLSGGAPYWAYNVKKNFVSLEMFQSAEGGSGVLEHLEGLALEAFPILSGARGLWQDKDLFFASSLVLACLYLFLLVFAFQGKWKNLKALLSLRKPESPAFVYCVILLAGALLVFSLSSFGHLTKEPRYLLPAYTALFPLLALGLQSAYRRLPLFSILCLLLLLFAQVFSAYPFGSRNIPGEPFVFKGQRVAHDHSELLQWLEKNEHPWVRTNYWIGYRLAFESLEKVRFLVFQEPYQVRIAQYEEEAKLLDKESHMPLVLVPAQGRLVEKALHTLGYTYEKENLSGYVVLFNFKAMHPNLKKVPTQDLQALSSHSSEEAKYALDGDRHTRWASHEPQKVGMEFRIRFAEAKNLSAIQIDMGDWTHDYPRSLRIEGMRPNGEVVKFMTRSQYRNAQYYLEWDNSWRLYIPTQQIKELRFIQVGDHPIFDWSMAEISLYEAK